MLLDVLIYEIGEVSVEQMVSGVEKSGELSESGLCFG